jgi:primase-polymerase (primpol)-like protein
MAPPPDRSSLPDSLIDCDQWLCWREQDRDGKLTKVPVDPTTGEFGSAMDPDSWTTCDEAGAYAERGDAAGVGFVFTEADPVRGREPRRLSRPGDGRDDRSGVVLRSESSVPGDQGLQP